METVAAKNDFSKGSMAKNILSLAFPMTIAQIINVLYNMVDRMYIGHLPESSALALTGLGLTFPIISIITGFANLYGMGGAPLCSIARGEGDDERAATIMGNSFALLLGTGVVLTLVFLLFKQPILYLFGASDATFPFADQYLTIYLCGNLFVMISLGMNSFINSQGFGRIGMMTVLVGAVVNILLDPVFIFLLQMGVRGAALATVIAQFLSAAWVLRFLTGPKAIYRLALGTMRLRPRLVKEIIGLGTSNFIMAMTTSLTQIVCNASLQHYGGDLYVGVMTVLNSVRELLNMPLSGVTSGAQPVLGFNYGAKQPRRVRQGIQFVSLTCIVYTLATWGLIMLAPAWFIRLFNSDPALVQAGVSALYLYFFGYFMMALQSAGQGVFVALGRSRQAIFFSLFRKVVIVVPLTLLLPRLWGLGVNGVFLAEPVSNFLGGGACFTTMMCTVWPMLKRQEKALAAGAAPSPVK